MDPFQALADASRREILMLLSARKLSINALAENFDISRPAVSKHVKALQEAGFIHIHNQGRERYCELQPEGFNQVQNWITYFEQFWPQKFKALEHLLNTQAHNPKTKRK